MSAGTYSIRDVLRRKRPEPEDTMPPAIVRLPVSCGEFVAQWPQHATAADLTLCQKTINAILGGWALEATRRGAELEAAEIEYRSWFSSSGEREGETR